MFREMEFFFSVHFVFVVLFKCNKFDEDVFPHQNLVVTMICRNLLKRVCYLIASSKSVHAEETKKKLVSPRIIKIHCYWANNLHY